MPAMSPTMTEGNIAHWKVNEGDSFSSGDVLLEIETDKAQMDVEAQEDGKMARITQKAGAKGVKVGTRIAILADQQDDLSSLELPAEEPSVIASPPKGDPNSRIDAPKSFETQAEIPPSSEGEEASAMKPGQRSFKPISSNAKPRKQRYPLYPSIVQLLQENGLPTSEADKIPASGPKGRLLKGDVLAYLGTISSSYPSEQSERIAKLGRLDLSNAKPAQKPAIYSEEPPPHDASAEIPVSMPDTEIVISISLSSVLLVQKRIQDTLGVTLPIATFIARATELANDELPRSATFKPTADELFNDVLGLTKLAGSKTSRGSYIPQVTALPMSSPTVPSFEPNLSRQQDIYDILIGVKPSAVAQKGVYASPATGIMAGLKVGEAQSVFKVSAAEGEEKRARVFLERVKTFLQIEPGRLIFQGM
ncbi:MAG: hypothetical protein Q9163_003158 [Psora crenata]